MRLASLACSLGAILVISSARAEQLDALWLLGSTSTDGPKLTLRATDTGDFPVAAPLTFACDITSRSAYEEVQVHFSIGTTSQPAIIAATQTIPLAKGPNSCAFHVDLASLAPGDYIANLSVQRDEESLASSQVNVQRVSDADFRVRARQCDARLDTVAAHLDQESSTRKHVLHARLNIAREAARAVHTHADAAEWHPLDAKLRFVERVAAELAAALTFAPVKAAAMDYALPLPAPVVAEGGAFTSNGRPVFLSGFAAATPDDLAQAGTFGLNAAALTIPPDALHAADAPRSGALEAWTPLLAAARDNKLALAILLAIQQPGASAIAKNPGLLEDGVAYLSNPAMREHARRHLQIAGPWLDAHPEIAAISLAEAPAFRFSGPAVHRAFIDRVRAMHPDRQELNRLWHAHLASFEDITIWDRYIDDRPAPKVEAWNYQNRRAYQADWQTYHQELGTQFFQWLRDAARESGLVAPLSVTLPDTVFTKGETRNGVDREAVARIFSMQSAAVSLMMEDSVYAYAYPATSANIAYLRSLAPEKPVLLLDAQLTWPASTTPAKAGAFVEAALWDAAISGADGLLLAANSPVRALPEALDAYARATSDLNRLAPIIKTFHQAPAEVGILLSTASKIMDDGDPHLLSALYAYEGASFSGYTIRFITETQCESGALDALSVLIIPETPAVPDAAFAKLSEYVERGGTVARVGTPIPYNNYGVSRTDVLRMTENTILVRGLNLPTEYLHAMDAAIERGALPRIPHAINAYGFPLEGVKTRYIEYEGAPYLFVMNIRKTPVECHLAGKLNHGEDLIDGREVHFPAQLEPMQPMLIRLSRHQHELTVTAASKEKK